MALRLLVAHAIGGAKWWKVEPERQAPHSEAIGAAIAALPTQAAFSALRDEMVSALGLGDDEGALIANDASGARTAAVFAKLLEMPDKDVTRLLAVVMAETLAAGTALIDALGQQLAVDVGAQWQPDEMFFGLLRDRETIGAMLTEVIGERAADSYLTATGTDEEGHHAQGPGRRRPQQGRDGCRATWHSRNRPTRGGRRPRHRGRLP